VAEVWEALAAGQTGLGKLTLFPSPRYGASPIAEVQRDLLALGAPRRGSRTDRLVYLAARDAIESARLRDFDADRAGVALGGSTGGSYDSEQFLTTLIKRGKMWPRPTRFHECANTTDLIADSFGFYGPSVMVATACSSGALSIATAADMIVAGDADVMLAGGGDSVSRMTWCGFHSLMLVDAQGCRPFDVARAGMSLGEGAAILVLEAEETARRRGAPILARLSGWGASCDAFHATAPHPEGSGAVLAMRAALRRANLAPAAIDYVNAHGTGTRDNDLAEGKALKTVFGERVPPFSSTKRFFGHSLGASGAIEAVVCVEALRRQELPANPGFSNVDPAIGLTPLTKFQRATVRHVMSNSFGFGGNNAVLVLSHADTPAPPVTFMRAPVYVTGVGVVQAAGEADFVIQPPLPAATLRAFVCSNFDKPGELDAGTRRRASRVAQMALVAAKRSGPATERTAVAIGTGLGCVGDAAQFIENVIAKDEAEPMPARFINSVHNVPAGLIGMALGARGFNSAPTCREISFEVALWQGCDQLATDSADAALVGGADELGKYYVTIAHRWGLWKKSGRPGEGAAVARLSPTRPGLARVTAVRLGRYRRPFDVERETAWIAAAVDLSQVDVILTGTGGWPELDDRYAAVVERLKLRHQTYKHLCGDFYAASAFGFAQAVELVRAGSRGVVLYTLSVSGGKAVCCVSPV
jgi:3-oxoacyl-(acyl-carrier-protein) synthase